MFTVDPSSAGKLATALTVSALQLGPYDLPRIFGP